LLLVAALLVYGATAGAQLLVDSQPSEVAQVKAVLGQAFEAMTRVDDYRGTMIKRELFGDELIEETIEFKFARPFKVYVKFVDPYTGREGIYVRGSNGNKVRVHKGSFPDLAMSLPPLGRIAMKGNHHPITSFGLERMLRVSAQNIRKMIRRGDATLQVSDSVLKGEPAWRIAIESKSGGYYVTARRSEDLWALAKRVGQNMYVILHHNEDIDSPKDVRSGQRVFVPHYYGSRGEYFFSKRTFMMIKASSWDQRGKLYESYEFTELELNPGLGDEAFDHRNGEYGFGPRDQR
jgi:outer membrane lipoprotein-sorting protein